MASQTTIPAAIDAIVTLFTTALATPYPLVKVYDGPPVAGDVPTTYVSIGYSEDEDAYSVGGSTSRFGEGVPAESYGINILISTWDGDVILRSKRALVGGIYNTLAGVIWADRTLTGLIKAPGLAEIGAVSWSMEQYEDGAAVNCQFTVDVSEAVLW